VTSEFVEFSVPLAGTNLGHRIADARRRAGLSQRNLASRIGTSIWKLDQIEQGRVDGSRLLNQIAEATGLPETWFAPVEAVESAGEDAGPRTDVSRTLEAEARYRRNFVLGGIALLLLIRFFTEGVHVVPRALNFIDIPLFVAFAVAAMAQPRRARAGAWSFYALPALLFLFLCVLSVTINPSRVAIGPVLVFMYAFLAPIGIYAAVYRLWPTGHALSVSRFLVGLGIIELLVVFGFDLPRFLSSSHNPDVVSGTFGTNAYQLVFFLLVLTGLLAGIRTLERRRIAARIAPAILALVLATIFLAQYRSLLATTAVSIIVIGFLLGSRGRGLVTALIIVAFFVVTLSYVSDRFPRLKFAKTIATLQNNPTFYASARLHAADAVYKLYEDKPLSIAAGTGPGTFSSRAWQTFSQAGSTSDSNVQGKYVLALTGGKLYHTDVSDKYVLPESQHGAVIEGSKQLSSPFATYFSLPAEVGLPGLILMVILYVRATLRAGRMTLASLRSAALGDSLPGLLIACTTAFVVLLQMGLLSGNWFEVTRITFLSWALLAIATREYEARSQRAA
jgi:transcriptional regulator with XRE-family HTH domain